MRNNKLPNNVKSSFWVYWCSAKFHLANISNTNHLNPGRLRSSRVQSQNCEKGNFWSVIELLQQKLFKGGKNSGLYLQRRSFIAIPIPKWITKTRTITKRKNIAGKKYWENLFKPCAVKVGIWKCKKIMLDFFLSETETRKTKTNNHSTMVSYQIAVQNQNKEIYEMKMKHWNVKKYWL